MTASEVGAVPDDVIEAARNAAYGATWGVPMSQIDLAIKAVLLVPSVAEVFARDAKVREIVTEFFAPEPHRSAGKPMRANNAFHDIAALYPQPGLDDSDIMPGSEFDGPVVL